MRNQFSFTIHPLWLYTNQFGKRSIMTLVVGKWEACLLCRKPDCVSQDEDVAVRDSWIGSGISPTRMGGNEISRRQDQRLRGQRVLCYQRPFWLLLRKQIRILCSMEADTWRRIIC